MTGILGNGTFWAALAVFAFLGLIYVAAGWLRWGLAGIAFLSAFTWYYRPGPVAGSLAWIGFALPYLLLVLPPLRRTLVTVPLMRLFPRDTPSLTAAERSALEAGTVGWESELFTGRPRWRRLLALPASRLGDEERAFCAESVDWLCAVLDEHRINNEWADLPEEVWQLLRERGFFGMRIPREYGGQGFSATGVSAILMRIASRSPTAAITLMIPNAGGPSLLIQRFGTDEQKSHWLPRLAAGDDIACLALTSLDAGSDLAAMTDHGVAHATDEGGVAIRLVFDKRYITLGPVCTLIALVFRLSDPEGLLGDDPEPGLSIALLPADLPGIRRGARQIATGTGLQIGPVRGKDVVIPAAALLGGAGAAGQAQRMLAECLPDSRTLTLPSLAAASAKVASRTAGAYARIRYQFDTYIGQFGGVQEALAQIAGCAYAIDAARLMAVASLDDGQRPTVSSALLKNELGQRCRILLHSCTGVFAGAAIFQGPGNLIGEIRKFADLSLLLDGTPVFARSRIGWLQGVARCHPYLREELEAAADLDRVRGTRSFDLIMARHIAFTASNALRSIALGLSAARLVPVPRGQVRGVRPYLREISRMSAGFALINDVLLLFLRGALRNRERIAGRMADILANLHLASAVVKHFHDQGGEEADQPLARWALEDCLVSIGASYERLFQNFPVPLLGRVLRRMIFPFGRLYRAPGDQLETHLARVLLAPGSGRERLCAGMYVPASGYDQVPVLEKALDLVIRSTPALRKLRAAAQVDLVRGHTVREQVASGLAAGVLSADEAALLRQAEDAREIALRVDEVPA